MKCLIYCREHNMEWIRHYLSDAEAYMLHIANKPLLEFFVEFCVLNEVKDIHIVREEESNEIDDYLGDGSRWDINLNYIELDKKLGLEEVISANKDLLGKEGLLVFNGFFFLQYKKAHLSESFLPQDTSWQNLNDSGQGILFLKSPASYKASKKLKHFAGKNFLISQKIDSIKDYFDLNMHMVNGGARNYIMPSYNSERGVYIGQNVEIMYSCDIIKPIILGDNIELKRRSEIGPGAIIGSDTLIDSDTTIWNSVVYCNSYIGSKLEIDNKIIYKRRVIDPYTGDMIHVVDDFLLAEVRNDLITSVMSRVFEVFLIVFLLCLQLPFYLILRPFIGGKYKEIKIWQDKSGTRKSTIKIFTYKVNTRSNKLFLKFSLHKFHLLFLCMTRRLQLIGSAPQEATKEALQNIRELSNYRPSVFSYSDMYGYEYKDKRRQVAEVFYAKHKTIGLNLAIFFKTLIFNFFRIVNVKKH